MIVRIRPQLNIKKIAEILGRTWESDDSPVRQFETAFSTWLGTGSAFAVDRGRSAFLLGLKILGVKKGDEVIVQSYIFHVVIDAVLEAGAIPVLADSCLDDFNVLPAAIEREITSRTKAIIVTHLGAPCEMNEIIRIARKHECYLIENCAHTLDAEYDGRKTGTFGDISFFSFDVDKPISTGDGGMLVINNGDLLEKARLILDGYGRVPLAREREIIHGLLLNHFVTREDVYPEKGFLPIDFAKRAVKKYPQLISLVESSIRSGADCECNELVLSYMERLHLLCKKKESPLEHIISRAMGRARTLSGQVKLEKIESPLLLMNSLRSAVGIECLKDYGSCKAKRDRNTQYYIDHLDAVAFRHPRIKDKKPSYIRYTVLNNTGYDNPYITRTAREKGLEIGIFNWSSPIHLCHPYNRLLSFDRSRLQNSEHLGTRLLSLPVHPSLNEPGLKKIATFLNDLSI